MKKIGRVLLKALVVLISFFGFAPVFGGNFVGWLAQERFITNWPLCASGVAVMALSVITLSRPKKGWAILLAAATGLELIFWAKILLSEYQFKVLGAALICGTGIVFMATIFACLVYSGWLDDQQSEAMLRDLPSRVYLPRG